MTKREATSVVAGASSSAGLPTLLERLDHMDRTLQISLGKPGLSLYGEAAAEIRRLMELLKGQTDVRKD